jgi:hypothetical protein
MLEDTFREQKIKGQTRIPAGTYDIGFRKEGRFYEAYLKSKDEYIKEFVKKYGVPHLQNVPNFDYILIHSGNSDADSSGCLISGNATINNSYGKGFVTDSLEALNKLFKFFDFELSNNRKLQITIIDFDRKIQGEL